MLTSNTITNIVAEFNVFNDNEQEYLITIPYSWTPPKAVSRDSYGVPLEPDDNAGTIDYKDEDISVFSIDEDGKYTKLERSENDAVLELAHDAFLGLNDTEDLVRMWHDNNDIFQDEPE